MIETISHIISGSDNRPILMDLTYSSNHSKQPIVIFCHGFKGFKDFAYFNLVAREMASAGIALLKFNFSHNGTTVESPTDFVDLEAFSQNNFSKELNDLGYVIDWATGSDNPITEKLDLDQIHLIGHSRGGGIALLKAGEDDRIKKLVTWAAVSQYGKFWTEEQMAQWKDAGVMYVPNSRTGQNMPLDYQMYDDYFANIDRLSIPDVAKKLNLPHLVVHGTDDPTVPFDQGQDLAEWSNQADLLTIPGGDHVFGGRHPWTETSMPADAKKVVEATINFLK